MEEKKKSETPSKSPSSDLPAVQCKDTLLLDYDYNQQYSKRKLVNNWDRYAELSDDEDNGQMSAADFEQILSASKSIGDHFTFASERSWMQNDESNVDLFKLNVGNLKSGLGRLPFYIRHGLSQDIFSEGELADMDYRVNFFESRTEKPAKESINQNLLNLLTDTKKEPKKPEANDPLEELLQKTSSIAVSKPPPVALSPTIRKPATASSPTIRKPAPSSSPTIRKPVAASTSTNQKTENIQDWLDDILNEN